MINQKAFEMIEGRFSDQVKLFNAYDVSGDDSDEHYYTVVGRVKLAKVALERAPKVKVTSLARSLGNRLNAVLEALHDKYGI
jgi:hypothetical protein